MQAFIEAYPGMTIVPSAADQAVLEGRFEFTASWHDGPDVSDAYDLRIEVPQYPQGLPRVFETGGRIPRNIDEHVFDSGRLCLGSELRQRLKIGPKLDLVRFADGCIVPYLYAHSRRPDEGTFVFGELTHGTRGLFDDYQEIFGVADPESVLVALRILAAKPSSADKHPCPCGCGRRLAQCEFRVRIQEIRQLAPRSCFKVLDDFMRKTSSGKHS